VSAERPREPTRFDELGGKTMAEWMVENNKDNKALQERQNRLRKTRAERAPREDPVRKGSSDGNPHQ